MVARLLRRAVFASLIVISLAGFSAAQDAVWDAHIKAGWDALNAGNLSVALAKFKDAARRDQSYQSNDIRRAVSLSGLGRVYQAQDKPGMAEWYFEQSLVITEKAVGPKDPSVAVLWERLGQVNVALQRCQQAEAAYKRSLAIRESKLDAGLVSALNGLAFLYIQQADYASARPLLERALATCQQEFGASDVRTGLALYNLAILNQQLRAVTDAEKYYLRALGVFEQSPDAQHRAAAVHYRLGLLSGTRRQNKEAEERFREALALYGEDRAVEDVVAAESAFSLAEIYRQRGDHAAAEPLYRRSMRIYSKTNGAREPRLADIADALAEMLRQNDRADEARGLESLYADAFLARAEEGLITGSASTGDDARRFLAIHGWRDQNSLLAAVIGHLGYRHSRDLDSANELLEEARSQGDPKVWPYPVVLYLAGDITGKELQSQAKGTLQLVLVQSCFGLAVLRNGESDNALIYLGWAAKHASRDSLEYRLAVAEIDRIERSATQ